MFKRLKWASKILTAENFLVMTDREAVINFEGKPPYTFEDSLDLAEQAAALEVFRDELEELAREHDALVGEVLQNLDGGIDEPDISAKEIEKAAKPKKGAK